MFKKRFVMGLAAAATMALGTSAAQASLLNSVITDGISSGGGGEILFELVDESRETLIKSDGEGGWEDPLVREPDAGTDSTLDEGDRLRGILRFSRYRVEQGTEEFFNDEDFEVTGVFDAVVSSKTDTGDGFIFEFAPYAGFAEELSLLSNVTASEQDLQGTMLAIFEDSAENWQISGDFDADFDAASDGDAWAFLGFTGENGEAASGEGWRTGEVETDDVLGVGVDPVPAADATVALNRIAIDDSLSSALTFLLRDNYDAIFGAGGAEFTAVPEFQTAEAGDWPVTNKATVAMNVVPTPTASLAGLMAFGMIAAAYRRRTGKAELATA